MNRSRRRVPAARPMLAALLVASLTACGSGAVTAKPAAAPSASAAPADTAVKVVGLPEGTAASIEDISDGVVDGEHLDFVSSLYTLAPAGELDSPVTVRLEIDNALPTTATVLVATRDSADQPFDYVRGYLTTDQQHVQFTTRKLNQVGVVSVDVPGAVNSLQQEMRTGLDAAAQPGVKKPACQGAAEARKDQYSVAASKRQTLSWCFGLQNGKRVVQLTNRRRVPMQVSHPGVAAVGNPRNTAAWASWNGILGLENTLLAPGQTAVYDAELKPRSRLVLTATSTRTAQSLRVLRATARALVLRLEGFGADVPGAASTFNAMVATPSCRRSLERGGAALLTGCLGQPQLAKLFPAAQLLADPLVSDPTFRSFLRSQARAVAEQVRAQEVQRVVVRRAAPVFDGFTGTWTGKGRSLSVSATGVVSESIFANGKLVIALTYRLADPTTKGTVSSAKATITAVKVGNRTLLDGRVPQVRDAGLLRISSGVVTPPFLQTSYCNAAKQKTCAG